DLEDGAHPDQRAVADARAVDDRAVANDDVVADVGGRVAVDVDDAVVLEVRPLADHHAVQVGAHDGPVPDRAVGADRDIADHGGGGRDEDGVVDVLETEINIDGVEHRDVSSWGSRDKG